MLVFLKIIFVLFLLFMVLSAIGVSSVTSHDRKLVEQAKARKAASVPDEAATLLDKPLAEIGLNKQFVTLLNDGGIQTVADLVAHKPEDLLEVKGIKQGRLNTIQEKVEAAGLKFDINAKGEPNHMEGEYFDEFYESPIYKLFSFLTDLWSSAYKSIAN